MSERYTVFAMGSRDVLELNYMSWSGARRAAKHFMPGRLLSIRDNLTHETITKQVLRNRGKVV